MSLYVCVRVTLDFQQWLHKGDGFGGRVEEYTHNFRNFVFELFQRNCVAFDIRLNRINMLKKGGGARMFTVE